eukprot:158845_1
MAWGTLEFRKIGAPWLYIVSSRHLWLWHPVSTSGECLSPTEWHRRQDDRPVRALTVGEERAVARETCMTGATLEGRSTRSPASAKYFVNSNLTFSGNWPEKLSTVSFHDMCLFFARHDLRYMISNSLLFVSSNVFTLAGSDTVCASPSFTCFIMPVCVFQVGENVIQFREC